MKIKKTRVASVAIVLALICGSSGLNDAYAIWNFSGTGNVLVAKSYRGTSGIKYRAKVSITINNETATATSGDWEL